MYRFGCSLKVGRELWGPGDEKYYITENHSKENMIIAKKIDGFDNVSYLIPYSDIKLWIVQ